MEQHPEFGTTIRSHWIQCKCRTVFVRLGAVGSSVILVVVVRLQDKISQIPFLFFVIFILLLSLFCLWIFLSLVMSTCASTISTGLGRGLRSQLSVQKSTMKNSVRQHVISVFDRHKEGHNEESPDLNATSSISMQWKAATCPGMDDKRWVERH